MEHMDANPPWIANGARLALGEADVAAFLTSWYRETIERVQRLGEGEWSTAFAFRRAAADLVVRFGAHRDDFDKDCLAARFGSADLPIPAVLEVGTALGGFYAVSARAFGAYLDDLDGPGMRAHVPSLLAALDAARTADGSGTRGYGAWNADEVAPHRTWREALLDVGADRPTDGTHGWRAKLAASAIGTGPFDQAFGHLRALIDACPEDRRLVHGDLLNYNVLVDGGRVSAVLDWGCSMYGDFLYDVAWFAYWAPWYPAWDGIDFVADATAHYAAIGLAVPQIEERIRAYQVDIGLAGLAYRAYKDDWAEVKRRGRRTLAIATRPA